MQPFLRNIKQKMGIQSAPAKLKNNFLKLKIKEMEKKEIEIKSNTFSNSPYTAPTKIVSFSTTNLKEKEKDKIDSNISPINNLISTNENNHNLNLLQEDEKLKIEKLENELKRLREEFAKITPNLSNQISTSTENDNLILEETILPSLLPPPPECMINKVLQKNEENNIEKIQEVNEKNNEEESIFIPPPPLSNITNKVHEKNHIKNNKIDNLVYINIVKNI